MVEIVVRGDSLVDDSALLIGSFMHDVPDRLDLVVEEGIFKKLAAHDAVAALRATRPGRPRRRT
jgi:hypothetical protein